MVIVALSLLGACSRGEVSAKADKPPGIRVKLALVQTATIESSSEFIASLQSRRSVTLQPRIEGQVTQILVKSGDQVAQGREIIQVDPAKQQASVNSYTAAAQAAQADLQNAKATLRSLEAQRLSKVSELKFNQLQYQRYANLYAQGAVSQQQQDQYANSLDSARSSLNALDQQILAQRAAVTKAEKSQQQAQANTKQEQVQLQYFKITAPFSGTVGDIPVKVGDFVNTSTKLTIITQNQPLEVNISVPIAQAPQLRIGMPIEVMDAQGHSIGTSRVFFISPNTTNNTQTVLVKSLLENSKNQLRADQFVRAKVIWNRRSGVSISTTAVSRIAGQNFVYVAQKQGKSQVVALQKLVKLGDIQGNKYHVIEGLQPGEKIAVTNVPNLSNGAAIIYEQ